MKLSKLSRAFTHLLFTIFFKFCFQTDGHREIKPVSLRSRKSRAVHTEEKKAEKKLKDKAYQAAMRMIKKLPKTSGDFSQSIVKFAFVPSCLMNSLSAAAYPKRPEDWTSQDLNQVLQDGNKMYREAMINEGNPEGSRMLDAFDAELIRYTVPPCSTVMTKKFWETCRSDFDVNFQAIKS